MKFLYDLSQAPASWDFATWLAGADMHRRMRDESLEVVLKPGERAGDVMSAADRARMLEHVMRPLVEMLGGTVEEGDEGQTHPYIMSHVLRLHRLGGVRPDFLANAQPQERGYVTITLREAAYWPQRNSDWDAWSLFAMRLEREGERIVWVRDTAKADVALPPKMQAAPTASKDVRARAALYAGAKVNYFVNNGPAMLCIMSGAPYRIFKPVCDAPACSEDWWTRSVGVSPGYQFPWATTDQRIVWRDDDFNSLFETWAADRVMEAA